MAAPSSVVSRHTVAALLTLTAVTGLLDAVSSLRLGHVFVANMTGNVVFPGLSAAPAPACPPPPRGPRFAGFIPGRPGRRPRHPHPGRHPASALAATTFTAEAALLSLAAALTGTRWRRGRQDGLDPLDQYSAIMGAVFPWQTGSNADRVPGPPRPPHLSPGGASPSRRRDGVRGCFTDCVTNWPGHS